MKVKQMEIHPGAFGYEEEWNMRLRGATHVHTVTTCGSYEGATPRVTVLAFYPDSHVHPTWTCPKCKVSVEFEELDSGGTQHRRCGTTVIQ